jgi:hypothetical protein
MIDLKKKREEEKAPSYIGATNFNRFFYSDKHKKQTTTDLVTDRDASSVRVATTTK